jgi:hypothetical protein
MNKAELRGRWEERVRMKDKGVLDAIWQDFEDSGDVDYALNEPETGLEDLVLDTENRLKYWRLGRGYAKPVGRSARRAVEVELSDYEKECAQTASLYLAKKVASRPEVRRFRQERLGGRLLTSEEAKEFLKREALSDLSNYHPAEYTGHYIAWVEEMSAEELASYVVPSGHKGVYDEQDGIFPYSYQGGTMVIGSRHKLDYGGLVLYLSAIFPWAPAEAGWFLLTGERPEVVPLRLSYHRRRQVFTLSFAPWISEKTVRKAYRKGQKVVQGGDNRRMKERTLAVVRFVTEHTDDEGRRVLSWSQLTDLWNEQHPGEWSFKDRFGLRRAYLRAEKELARPWR